MKLRKASLLKPIVHPVMNHDESPYGYLIRIAGLNKYKLHKWLFDCCGKISTTKSSHNLYRVCAQAEWTGCDLKKYPVNVVLSLNVGYFINNKLRYCPLCIRDHGYFRIVWQYRVSVVCKDHGIWLHDRCHLCGNIISGANSNIYDCSCGADLREAITEKVPDEVLAMQCFLEGAYESICDDPLVLKSNHGLNIQERLDILAFLSRWLRNRGTSNTRASISLRDMDTAQDCMSDVAEALFSGRAGFNNFLKRLHKLGFGCVTYKSDLFTKFYRAFYKDFPQKCFSSYKHSLEQYLNRYWEKPLTRRNRHFGTKTLEAHPWISFQTACREYDIYKSVLKRAIDDRLIRALSRSVWVT